ncbi:MAG: lipoate-protein ligase [Anaerophaga sp.]|jgi:lipoyl(octanoyl) transferase|uniref:lipoyl(octanoyl) transferase LipB n=1 Tax=Anaerophaga thermohalophila TaxID=177400 RepID=UPI000237C65C|nr:lipoyl(octanoyl) transferase LipB [Anaerophaga thermohalophila]MBZ4676067.1 lipoate-protein ligase [Anaerophaga sp.]MDI3521078.1 lipoyl(octanoyl) transferase [Anaerophaga sp.]MDN5291465.1 lipoyl(octanoyl) transferase [Anaerophaga sp.]
MTAADTIFEDLGEIDYKAAWDYQEEQFRRIVDAKLFNREHPEENKPVVHHLIFCEHPHVFTLGKSGQANNLLVQDDFLKKINASFYRVNRGGDITYHGPGQIVGYPIFDLEQMKLGVKEYIFKLEEAIILTLAAFGIEGERLDGATGVWLETQTTNARKICAIGVRASRFVSMHGFALNVNTNLDYFNYINPCGFVDKGVTSMQKEKGETLSMEEVKAVLKRNLQKVFGLNFV